MITTGIIREINLSSSTYSGNKYLIEINLFQSPGDYNKDNYTYSANCSTLPGHYDSYTVGDRVYVGFLNDDLSVPIILGKIYQGRDSAHRSQINCENLDVSMNAQLPKSTKIGDITYQQLLTLFRKQPKKYYNHIISVLIEDTILIKFKFMSTSNCDYSTETSTLPLIDELLRLNDECSILGDAYIKDEETSEFIYANVALVRIDSKQHQLFLLYDDSVYPINSILSDLVIEV